MNTITQNDAAGPLVAIHLRHDDIREEEMTLALLRSHRPISLASMASRERFSLFCNSSSAAIRGVGMSVEHSQGYHLELKCLYMSGASAQVAFVKMNNLSI